MSQLISAAVARLRAELAAAAGGGLSGYSDLQAYPAGTIGQRVKAIKDVTGGAQVGITDAGGHYAGANVELALQEVGASIAGLDARRLAVVNILPNTRWHLGTGLADGLKWNETATAALPNCNVTSYTNNANLVTFNTTNTSMLQVGGLVAMGAPADANMRLGTTLRVLSITPNVSFTARLPNGLRTGAASSVACIATPYDAGGAGSVGSGNAFDGWTKTTATQCWRDSFASNVQGGNKYSAALKKGTAGSELFYVAIDPRDVRQVAGKNMAARFVVKAPAGGSWRIFTSDNISGQRNGATVNGAGGFESSEFTFLVPAGIGNVAFGIELFGPVGATFYVSEAFAGQGTIVGQGAVQNLQRNRLVPVVKFSPYSWVNANMTFPTVADSVGLFSFVFDPYAETNGAIAPEVRALDVIIEGFNLSAVITGTGARVIATRDQEPVPHKYGPIMFQQAANVKTAAMGTLTLGPDGTARVYGLSGDNWANVSMDINGVIE
jgi:hypothetical protein